MVQIFDLHTFWVVFLSMVTATIKGIASVAVVKEIGPVAQQIMGQLKGVLACMAAVTAFGEVITAQQAIGYGACISGILWYNTTENALKNKNEKGAEGTPLLAEKFKV